MMMILAVVIWAWLAFYVIFELSAVAKDTVVEKIKRRKKK